MSKKVLVISPRGSHPQTSGDNQRVYRLLLNLAELGHDLHFAYVDMTPHKADPEEMRRYLGTRFHMLPSRKRLSTSYRAQRSATRLVRFMAAHLQIQLGVTFPTSVNSRLFNSSLNKLYDTSLDPDILALNDRLRPDVVIVEYAFLSKTLNHFSPHVMKIIDTHDILADRYKMFLANKKAPAWLSTTEADENQALSRADIIFAIQDREAAVLRARLRRTQVITVGHTVILDACPCLARTQNMLFVGSGIDINYYSVRWLLDHLLPTVAARHKSAHLFIAGGICKRINKAPHCTALGVVPNMRDVYRNTRVVLNPIPFGTGLKIKNIEALGYGKPLITTATGSAGLEQGAGTAFFLADHPGQYLGYLNEMFSDQSRYESICASAYDFARRWNEDCLNALRSALE